MNASNELRDHGGHEDGFEANVGISTDMARWSALQQSLLVGVDLAHCLRSRPIRFTGASALTGTSISSSIIALVAIAMVIVTLHFVVLFVVFFSIGPVRNCFC